MPHANLAVSLDTPLYPLRPTPTSVDLFTSLLRSRSVRAGAIAFCFAFLLSLAVRTQLLNSAFGTIFTSVWRLFRGQVSQVVETIRPPKEGVLMPFTKEVNDGWGVCKIKSRRRVGSTGFIQFDFDLPKSDYVLSLKLGQPISMCCLDGNGSVVKGTFYTYEPESSPRLGMFSILVPSEGPAATKFALGEDTAKFVQALKEMKGGDEIALKPLASRLKYEGQALPVTDVVYVAYGIGIVPILDQLKSVLPTGASSVGCVSVVWISPQADDFDVIAGQLEQEYLKYTTKLAVTCVVDNMVTNSFGDNRQIEAGIPSFIPGTMAAISVPSEIAPKTRAYLSRRGYPDDCVCEL